MPVAAPLIIGAATLGGGLLASSASKHAAKAQENAANQAEQTQQHIFDQQVALQEPFRQGGISAENRLLTLLGLGPTPQGSGLNVNAASPDYGKYARDFSMSDFTAAPGYQFRLDQGMKALNASMAAKGLGVSGANIKGALEYGQNEGSQEYQNAFNRYQVNRANQLNPLQSLMGGAQTSANTLGQAAQNMGNNVSDLQTQAGNARASGYVGQANAITGALGQGLNAFASMRSNSFSPSMWGGGSYQVPATVYNSAQQTINDNPGIF